MASEDMQLRQRSSQHNCNDVADDSDVVVAVDDVVVRTLMGVLAARGYVSRADSSDDDSNDNCDEDAGKYCK